MKKEIYDETWRRSPVRRYPERGKVPLRLSQRRQRNATVPTATLQMEVAGELLQEAGFGVGPVDATFAAIRKITKTNYPLLKYAVNAVTGGTDAQGEATVQLKFNGRSAVGRGAHPDILVASAKAYINALNRLEWLSKDVRKVKVA
jgi:2-isopropylmalate synthase